MDFFVSTILVFVATILIYFKFFRKPTNFPPGPPRIPLVGSIPFLPKEVRSGKKRLSTYLKEKYGPISGFFSGVRPTVVITDFNMIKELYKMEVASYRPHLKPFHELRFGDESGCQRGLLQSSGAEWVEQRRFALRQLRDLGFGKSSMEDMINDEVDKLVHLLQKESEESGGKSSLNLRLNISIVNALWILLVGEKLHLEDPHLKEIIQIFDSAVRANARINFVLNAISPTLTKKFDGTYKMFENTFEAIKNLVTPYIDEHKKSMTQDLNDDPRDFVDVYLREIHRTSDQTSSFHGARGTESLISVLLDLFLAGTETTTSSLLWTFLFLLHHPEIQDKVFQEIDKVVGRDRRVSLEDRANLPYTQAVMMESMRMASLVPAGLAHSVSKDLQFEGYTLPKGCVILASIFDVHYDPTYWSNPEVFDPNRFFDEKTNAYVPNERLIPFLIGKRFCLGQSLAEKEFFLFFVGLVQKFEFLRTDGKISDLPPIDKGSGIQIGTIRCCPLYDVILRKRV